MLKKQLLILLLIFGVQNSSCILASLFSMVEIGWKLALFINDVTFTKDTVTGITSSFTGADDHQEIIGKFNEINNKLDDLKSWISNQLNYIDLLIQQMPIEIEIQTKKDRLVSFILAVDRLWDDLVSYIKRNATNDMLNDLANDIVVNLKLPLQEFRQVLTPLPGTGVSENHGLFFLIVENADTKRDILCDQSETSHHSILRVFHIAVATEVKALILLSFAHHQKYSDNDGWKVPLEAQFKQQINRYLSTVLRSLNIARLPYIRSCDPHVWRTDDNYYGLYGFHQRTVYHITDLKWDPDRRLRLRCLDLNYLPRAVSYDDFHRDVAVSMNNHSKCIRRPFNCRNKQPFFRDFISCAWDQGPYKIRYVKYEGQIFGTDKEAMEHLKETDELTCPEQNAFNRRWYYLSAATEYECICQCRESDLRLLGKDMISKIDDNCIIVGLRIHRVHDYIYIQIAEGELKADGHISNSSWVPATRVSLPEWQSPYFDQTYAVTEVSNIFKFGDVQLPPGFVLTGIQFCWFPENDVLVVGVRLRGNEFDHDTGRLNQSNISVHQLGNEGKFDRELTIPTKTPINKVTYERSTPKSDGYTHVRLQISDTSDDFGQTTLPLLDGVPIMTNPLSPIGGVGLFYRGYTADYAGFLSLRIYPLNYTYLMKTSMNTPNVSRVFLKTD